MALFATEHSAQFLAALIMTANEAHRSTTAACTDIVSQKRAALTFERAIAVSFGALRDPAVCEAAAVDATKRLLDSNPQMQIFYQATVRQFVEGVMGADLDDDVKVQIRVPPLWRFMAAFFAALGASPDFCNCNWSASMQYVDKKELTMDIVRGALSSALKDKVVIVPVEARPRAAPAADDLGPDDSASMVGSSNRHALTEGNLRAHGAIGRGASVAGGGDTASVLERMIVRSVLGGPSVLGVPDDEPEPEPEQRSPSPPRQPPSTPESPPAAPAAVAAVTPAEDEEPPRALQRSKTSVHPQEPIDGAEDEEAATIASTPAAPEAAEVTRAPSVVAPSRRASD